MLDLNSLMTELAGARPLFHSEADFQHALAMAISRAYPAAAVRPERPMRIGGGTEAVDIVVMHGGHTLAIELKFWRPTLRAVIDGEQYDTRSHNPSLSGYDAIKDIVRMERFVRNNRGATAAVLVLSLDERMHRPGEWWRQDVDLLEGTVLEGERGWHESMRTTKKGTYLPHNLRGRYEIRWRPYSAITDAKGRALVARFLHVAIKAEQEDAGDK